MADLICDQIEEQITSTSSELTGLATESTVVTDSASDAAELAALSVDEEAVEGSRVLAAGGESVPLATVRALSSEGTAEGLTARLPSLA